MDPRHTEELWQGGCGGGIYHSMFRMIAIADLYGPERAIQWAQTLLDDPELLSAFSNLPTRPAAEIVIRRLHGRAASSPAWN
jgi:hypothetical protein